MSATQRSHECAVRTSSYKGEPYQKGGRAGKAGRTGAGRARAAGGQDEGRKRKLYSGMRKSLPRLLLFAALVGVAGTVNGEVTRVDIAKRTDVGTSGYEKIVGTIHFAVDPGHQATGSLSASTPRRKTRPDGWSFPPTSIFFAGRKARSGNVALVEVSNRGHKGPR